MSVHHGENNPQCIKQFSLFFRLFYKFHHFTIPIFDLHFCYKNVIMPILQTTIIIKKIFFFPTTWNLGFCSTGILNLKMNYLAIVLNAWLVPRDTSTKYWALKLFIGMRNVEIDITFVLQQFPNRPTFCTYIKDSIPRTHTYNKNSRICIL